MRERSSHADGRLLPVSAYYFRVDFLRLSGLSDSYHAHATTAPAPAIAPAANEIPAVKIYEINIFPPLVALLVDSWPRPSSGYIYRVVTFPIKKSRKPVDRLRTF